jgi:hypothetical protein
MKIIITESQYIKLLESTDKSNVVEQILDLAGVKFTGCEYGVRTYDTFGRQRDSVYLFFTDPIDPDYAYRKTINFLTKNNKVVEVYNSSDFRPLAEGLRYIPIDILMGYFFEKAKTYLEKTLPDMYPNDNLKESVIKEDNLKSELKQMVKSDGWESTYPLVGDAETLAQFAFDNNPMEFIDSLGLKKHYKVSSGSFNFKNDKNTPFLVAYPTLNVVEVNIELSEFLYDGFNLGSGEAKKVIKDWLFDRHGIDITRIYL